MRILSLREAFKETLGFQKALTQLLDDVRYNQEGEGSCNVHLNPSPRWWGYPLQCPSWSQAAGSRS